MSDITCGSPAVPPPSHASAARDVLLEVLCFFQGLTCSQCWIGSNNQFDSVPRQSATNVSITVAVIRSTPHPTFPKSLHRLSNILKHLWGVIWEVQRERHANIFLLPKENILRRGGEKNHRSERGGKIYLNILAVPREFWLLPKHWERGGEGRALWRDRVGGTQIR